MLDCHWLGCLQQKYSVVGFDINIKRIDELISGIDTTFEISNELLSSLISSSHKQKGLFCSYSVSDIEDCNYYIVTVPTPVDKNNLPNLNPLIRASETVGSVLKKDDMVIYESTVYLVPEEECIPILEKTSSLKFNRDFYVGYSPERINPGDKQHTIDKILKVTSGSTPKIGRLVNKLYKSVITAGTHLAPNIKEVAEAAKIIENSQRDINIAFVNELAKIFNLLDINTNDVLKAASTKWNFLSFKPGLVGGHCIGVDPYYLAQKAQKHGYNPEIILAGRRLNDSMGRYVASEVIKLMLNKNITIEGSEVLILGITFKENCPDVEIQKLWMLYLF